MGKCGGNMRKWKLFSLLYLFHHSSPYHGTVHIFSRLYLALFVRWECIMIVIHAGRILGPFKKEVQKKEAIMSQEENIRR